MDSRSHLIKAKSQSVSLLILSATLGTILGGGFFPSLSRAAAEVTNAPLEIRELNWDKFRHECEAPQKGDVRRLPSEIKIVCRDHQTHWLAGPPGQILLKGSRKVLSSVNSDRFRVAGESRAVDVAEKNGSCHRFYEVTETFSAEVPVTCEDVQLFQGDLHDLCLSKLDEPKNFRRRDSVIEETGQRIDTCLASQAFQAAPAATRVAPASVPAPAATQPVSQPVTQPLPQ